MGTFYEGPICGTWYRVSDALTTLSAGEGPWQCGLFLLEDEHGGINYEFNSPHLAELIGLVKDLYRNQESNLTRWQEAEKAVRAGDWNALVLEPLNTTIAWSEYHALATLVSMIRAVTDNIQGKDSNWRHPMAQASLNAATFRGGIAVAKLPGAPTPSSALYEERIKEMAAVEAWRANIQSIREYSDERAYDAQSRYFATLVRAFEQKKRAAIQAEQARLWALPFYSRWVQRLKRAGK